MESPPVRNDLRFIVGLLPFGNSLTLSHEIAVSFSLRGIQEPVLFRVHSHADSVSCHNHNRAIRHLPGIRIYVGEPLCGFIPVKAVWGPERIALRFVLSGGLDLEGRLNRQFVARPTR